MAAELLLSGDGGPSAVQQDAEMIEARPDEGLLFLGNVPKGTGEVGLQVSYHRHMPTVGS